MAIITHGHQRNQAVLEDLRMAWRRLAVRVDSLKIDLSERQVP
jgi:hypothetical protein